MHRIISTLILTIGLYGILSASEIIASAAGPGCTISFQQVVTDNPNGCSGSEDGFICVTINGTVSDEFELSINNGLSWTYGKKSICIEDLPSGSYNLQIKEQSGCTVVYSGNPVVLGVDNPVTINEISTTPQTYSALGGLIVTATGLSPFQYRMNSGTWQTSEKFSDLEAGTYDIDVKDVNGCIVSDEAIVADERCPEFTVDKTTETNCFSPNGSITITSIIGIRPLTYSNDNGATWQSDSVFSNLSGGLYQLAVKGDNGCITYNTTNVSTSFVQFSGSSSVVNVAGCMGDATGEIHAARFGGGASDEFSIDGGTTWQSNGIFTGLTAGYYTAIVRDNWGCTDTTVFTITQPIHDTIDFVMVENATGCTGDPNGSIAIDELFPAPPASSHKGASATKSYSINGGITWQSGKFFNNLPAGEYNPVVKVDGCVYPYYLNPVTVEEPVPVVISTVEIVGDYGSSSGQIAITASGGGESFEYSIDGGETFSFEDRFTGLANGTYNLVVRDYLGCSADSSVALPDWSITISDVSFTDSLLCYSDENGSITITASGGKGPLNYTIDNGFNWQLSNEFTRYFGGEYTIQVKDANDSIVSWSGNPVIIYEPEEIYFDFNRTHPTCDGINDGTIEFFDVEGGTGSYMFSIDGGITYSPESLFDSLAPGDYDLFVMDENGCTSNDYIDLREPISLHFDVEAFDISCFGASDGTINCGEFILGVAKPDQHALKSKTSNYYSIDNGTTWQTNEKFENLLAGEYYVWMKISDVCMKDYEHNPVVIEEPEKISIESITITPDDGTSNGQISIEVSGGTGIKEFSIDGGMTYSWGLFGGLSSGDYSVIIKDGENCTIDTLVYVNYDPIHDLEHIQNTSYNHGDTTCLGAYVRILVGGNGSLVDFNLGSSTSLIAGSSITFLPGVHIFQGAYLTATITTDSSFCDIAEAFVSPVIATDITNKSKEEPGILKDQCNQLQLNSLKVFPNPNNGRFVVELSGCSETIRLHIYNSLGSVVYNDVAIDEKYSIEIGGLKRGLYFIKAFDGANALTKKMIVE
jgi:hypothetical protein